MPNEYINKVVYYGDTLIDLTTDTVTQSDVLSGKYFHLPSGQRVQGSCTYDAYTADADAVAGNILLNKTAYVNGNKITGSMANIGKQTGTITTKAQQVSISAGYHDGSGKVSIDSTEQSKIVAGNIKNGVQILGVTGTYTGSELIKATAGSAVPATTQQVLLPSDFDTSQESYDYFTQFTVDAIPYVETDNAQGGVTVTIG